MNRSVSWVKPALAALALAAAAYLPATHVRAGSATPIPSLTRQYRAAITRMLARVPHLDHKPILDALPHDTAALDPTSLQLPVSAFSPALVDISSTEDNASADKDYLGGNHKLTYEALGRGSGYYQRAVVPGTVVVRYQGSTFANPTAAFSALLDGVTSTQSLYQADANGSCADAIHSHCSIMTYTVADASGALNYEIYGLVTAGRCLGEDTVTAPYGVWQASAAALATLASNVQVAAYTALSAACDDSAGGAPTAVATVPAPPTSTPTATATRLPTATPLPTATAMPAPMVHILALGLVNKMGKILSSVKSGTPALFAVQADIANAGTNAATATITFKQGSKTLGSGPMDLQTQTSTGVLFTYGAILHFKKSAHLTVQMQVSLGPAHDQRSAAFTVKPNCTTTRGVTTCK